MLAKRSSATIPFFGLAAMLLAVAAFVTPVTAAATTSAALPTPGQIVERADAIRFPQAGFQVDVIITTTEPGRKPDVRYYRVLSKGHEKSLVLTLSPPADRGTIMLMRGSDLWVFVPSVSMPIRLPLSQRLTGQVANGDLARANFAGDYKAKLLRIDRINNASYYVLDLTAAHRGVTYHRVRYWVDTTNFHPYEAQFYTLSGRLMKTCRYEDYGKLGGAIRPTRMVMTDALKKNEVSVLSYRAMKRRVLPDMVFTKEYLKKLQ